MPPTVDWNEFFSRHKLYGTENAHSPKSTQQAIKEMGEGVTAIKDKPVPLVTINRCPRCKQAIHDQDIINRPSED
jgi:hypothetical protein